MKLMRLALLPFCLIPFAAWAAYDANEIVLGATEKAVAAKFPSAHCKALEWTSAAADRRCDDAKILFGGVQARITFYLKQDRVQAFDVRYESKDTERLVQFLKPRYGAPTAEVREKADGRRGGDLVKLEWKKGDEQALLVSQTEQRRASLTVWRGNFEEEIYRVR
jgi:hypothetical protein